VFVGDCVPAADLPLLHRPAAGVVHADDQNHPLPVAGDEAQAGRPPPARDPARAGVARYTRAGCSGVPLRFGARFSQPVSVTATRRCLRV
jgi:hypothetical protein